MVFVDSFLFFNELELLEIRLYELAPIIDTFILLEAPQTHQGKSKPLYFDENKSWFKDYNITHLIEPLPYVGDNTKEETWENEIYCRNKLSEYFERLPNTIAMLSDVDEIPARETIEKLTLFPIKIKQRSSYYYLNMVADKPVHCEYGTTIARQEDFVRIGGQKLRDCIWSPDMPSTDGGWHFSYMGGADKIKTKLEAFTHSEYNTPYFTNINRIKRLVSEGKDLFDRDMQFKVIPIDKSFPALIREHPERFVDLIAS
jgi:beta-1,4-mannosyl-glycoprotein beta-1,4-N-acetylglucosaminyltransferase